jgi:hypothetical protein
MQEPGLSCRRPLEEEWVKEGMGRPNGDTAGHWLARFRVSTATGASTQVGAACSPPTRSVQFLVHPLPYIMSPQRTQFPPTPIHSIQHSNRHSSPCSPPSPRPATTAVSPDPCASMGPSRVQSSARGTLCTSKGDMWGRLWTGSGAPYGRGGMKKGFGREGACVIGGGERGLGEILES